MLLHLDVCLVIFCKIFLRLLQLTLSHPVVWLFHLIVSSPAAGTLCSWSHLNI